MIAMIPDQWKISAETNDKYTDENNHMGSYMYKLFAVSLQKNAAAIPKMIPIKRPPRLTVKKEMHAMT